MAADGEALLRAPRSVHATRAGIHRQHAAVGRRAHREARALAVRPLRARERGRPMMNADRQAWVDKARAVRIEDELDRRAILLAGNSKEREGPCPVCGGTDRFSVNTAKQVFNCR